MRERSVACCICQRDTFHDSAVCDRGACQELMAHAERRIQDRLAARAIRQAGSDAATSPSSGVAATSATVVPSRDALHAGDRGISSTGPGDGCSPGWPGPVDTSGSGSKASPSAGSGHAGDGPTSPPVAPLPSP